MVMVVGKQQSRSQCSETLILESAIFRHVTPFFSGRHFDTSGLIIGDIETCIFEKD